MSSTSNSQNLLVNVFRPVYTYSAGSGFTPRLVVSNVDILSAGAVQTGNFQFGDANNNLFIGSNAGGGSNNASNVGIGVGAMNNKTNSTGTVAIGTNTLQGATAAVDTTAIGTEITGGGTSNVILGARSGTIGSNMILLGPGLATTGDVSGKLYIGQSNISNSLIYGDFNQRYVGINRTDPTTNLDVSGDMRVTRWLSAGFSGAYSPQGAIDANGYVYASLGFRAQGGSAANPAFTFIDDSGTGFFQNDTSGFAISAKGVRIMDISADNTVYIYGNLKAFGSVNIGSVDTSSFVFSDGYVRDNAVNPVTDVSRAGIRTTTLDVSSLLQTSNGMFRVGPSGAPTVDISGSSIRAANIYGTSFVQSPFFHDAASTFDLSSGNLRVNSNIVVSNVLRTPAGAFRVGAITGPLTDISGGNIRTLGAVDISSGSVSRPSLGFVRDPSSGIHSGGTSILAFDTSGIQRMTLSNGNLGIGKATPVVALEVVGDVSATTYNGPGGTATDPHYTFSDDRKTGLFFPGANQIGFTAGSTERMRISNGFVGIGTTAPTTALEISGGALRITSASGGAIVLSNGQIDVSGVTVVSSTGVFSNAATTSNSIGGVILENSNVTSSNFTTPTASSNRIGGVTLSNNNISYSGTITGSTANTSNSIGGVTLSNNNISYSGTITGSTANTSNQIGGVILSNTIVRTGDGSVSTPSHSFSSDTSLGLYRLGSNQLGFTSAGLARMTICGDLVGIGTTAPQATLDVSAVGSTIRITDLRTSGTPSLEFVRGTTQTFGGDANTDWRIRNVGGDLTFTRAESTAGANLNGQLVAMTYDGRLDVSGVGMTVAGYLRSAVTPLQFDISGGNISNSATHTTANLLASGYLRNALTPSQFDISGGNISNSATHTTSNLIASGYLRNALTPSQFDISGGNISNSATHTTSNLITGGGSASAPAIRSSTTNLGIYYPNTTEIAFVSGGADKFRVSGSGIYNDTTTSNTVSGIVLSNGVLRTGDGAAGTPSYTFSNDTALGLYRAGANQIGFATAGTQKMVISNANVGIATPTPGYPLDVSGTTRTKGVYMDMSSVFLGDSTSSNTGSITFTTTYGIDSNAVEVGTNTGTWFRVRKHGIYAVNVHMVGNAGSSFTFVELDACGGNTWNGGTSTRCPIAMNIVPATAGNLSMSFVGYLPSNDTIYYKICTNATTFSNAQINWALLYQTPSLAIPYRF